MNKTLITILFSFAILITNFAKAQLIPPYYNNFDNSGGVTGWSHYALTGSDNWQLGIPGGLNLNKSFSGRNVWATNLDGNFTANSKMCLQTPAFDLSSTTTKYKLGFAHQEDTYSYHGGNIEYSIDSGVTWTVLDGNSNEKSQWYNNTNCAGLGGQPSWSDDNYSYGFTFSYHSLDFLSGQSNVLFRFQFGGTSNPLEGWVIDNFSIEENKPNVYAIQSSPMHVSKRCPTYAINLTLVYSGVVTSPFSNTANYYWSTDSIFDGSDPLIGSMTQEVYGTMAWNKTFNVPPGIAAGKYYIFNQMDAANNLIELNESDNLGAAVLIVDSILNIPLVSNFDDSTSAWQNLGNNYWQLFPINTPGYEGTHSGNLVWSLTNPNGTNYLQSPHLDLSQGDSLSISFWYRYKSNSLIKYSVGCSSTSNTLAMIFPMRDNTWDFYNATIPAGASVNDVRLDIFGQAPMVLDDIYIGKTEPDLSIERKEILFASSSGSGTIKYFLNNSGQAFANASVTSFYWSTDSIFDGSDSFLGTNNEPFFTDTARVWRTFTYTKPTTASGKFYILYFLDVNNVVTEMREYNNTGYFVLNQSSTMSIPYYNDFETQITSWTHTSTIGKDDWQWTNPKGHILNQAFSGSKVWITNDTGIVSPNSRMHLYSPIFNLSNTVNPVMEFDMKLHSEGSCYCFEGKMNMSYSVDGGATWKILDTTNQSYNRWYYPMSYDGFGGVDKNYYLADYTEILFATVEKAFSPFYDYNGRDSKRTTRYILDLNYLKQYSEIQFRYNLGTLKNTADNSNFAVEGALIDNFSIRESFIDLTVEYKRALMMSSKSPTLQFAIDIKNNGNYISNKGIAKFYLSKDTLFDGSDYFLGEDSIPEVRPDLSHYLDAQYQSPGNLSSYTYLLYQLDATSTSVESNELNNRSYWNLALDSISNLPYLNDFNDTIVNGWRHYVVKNTATYPTADFRVRNMVAPSETFATPNVDSGRMFTDAINGTTASVQVPYWYLESPAFDFSKYDSLTLSFDLKCSGRNSYLYSDGGNLDVSTDGGNTWILLTDQNGQATNWYDFNQVTFLNSEPGWSDPTKSMAPRKIDISFLRGNSHVVFRFKYGSNWDYFGVGNVQGFQMDNFLIEGEVIDYVANAIINAQSATLGQPQLLLDYSITNTGAYNGRASTTKFYWSKDPIFDSGDSLLKTINENVISAGAVVNLSTSINYPTSIAQEVYYILYKIDANNAIAETNELNNMGVYKIMFDPFINYAAVANLDTLYFNPLITNTINFSYSIINTGLTNGPASTTGFYWSSDSLLDANDVLIYSINENSILSYDTLLNTSTIQVPSNLTLTQYYLIFKTDNNNTIVEGSELDNTGFTLIMKDLANYKAFSFVSVINTLIVVPSINLSYSIVNNGRSDGLTSTTAFFWSSDNILDAGDTLLKSVSEPVIIMGDTTTKSLNLVYPTPIVQYTYYLFCISDYNNVIAETNETDNTYRYEIDFDNITTDLSSNIWNPLKLYTNDKKVYINMPYEIQENKYKMNFVNSLGEIQQSSDINIKKGLNSYSFPPNLASGLYLISVFNEKELYVLKVIIEN